LSNGIIADLRPLLFFLHYHPPSIVAVPRNDPEKQQSKALEAEYPASVQRKFHWMQHRGLIQESSNEFKQSEG